MHTCKTGGGRMLTCKFGNDAFNLTLAVVSNLCAVRISAFKCYPLTILFVKSSLGLLLLEATQPPEDTGSVGWPKLGRLCVDGLCSRVWVSPTSSEQNNVAFP